MNIKCDDEDDNDDDDNMILIELDPRFWCRYLLLSH